MSDILQEVACPNCRSPIDIRYHGKHVTCDACSSQFLLVGHLCPHCQTYHEKEVSFCGTCGKALNRVCRKCRTPNWAGDEYCHQCGTAMDLLDLITARHQKESAEQMEMRREQIARLKILEEEASRRRMEELMEIEATRREELLRRRNKQKERERMMVIITGIIVAVFILMLLAFYILRAGA